MSSVRLMVRAADPTSEIAVLDGGSRRVARDLGHLRADLAPGLYKLRLRTGPAVQEQIIVLDRDLDMAIGAKSFPTPIPLAGIAPGDEDQQQAASDASQKPQLVLGHGASIFVFARARSDDDGRSGQTPVTGLSLRGEDGSELARLADRATLRGGAASGRDPSAAWCAEVAPGAYRLRLDLPDGTGLERALFVTAGMQAQLFLVQRDQALADGRQVRLPHLRGAALAIATPGFTPGNRHTRLSELARYALAQDRRGLSDMLVDELLGEKLEDLMLGLVGAHLILRDRILRDQADGRDATGAAAGQALFRRLTDRLLPLLGADHPDLAALWLWRPDAIADAGRGLRTPPMLRASWNLVIRSSVRHRDATTLGPGLCAVGAQVLPTNSWLLWRADTGTEAAARGAKDRLDAMRETIADYLDARQRQARRSVPRASVTASLLPEELTLSDREEFALRFGVPGPVLDALIGAHGRRFDPETSPGPAPSSPDDAT